MRILVVTVVHTPLDARVHGRQIAALRAAGHDVTYLAPWSAYGVGPGEVHSGVVAIDVPRASGRQRVGAWRVVRGRVAALAPRHDVVLLHDPELLVALAGLRELRDRVVVWDVHEDTRAALVDKPWLPDGLRGVTASVVGWLEGSAERRHHLLLAEERYADRFGRQRDGSPHPVVPNTPVVPDEPPPGPTTPPRAVQVGRLSALRGAHELVEVGRHLAGEVEVHLVGTADADVEPALRAAHDRGEVVWHGFVPNDRALAMLEGASAGLALLHDVPNYRQSMPTKVFEYLSRAVPVVTTPLPLAAEVVQGAEAGRVVPFGDAGAAADAVRSLVADSAQLRATGVRGWQDVRRNHAWNVDGPAFVAVLEQWVAAAGPVSRAR